MAIGWKKSAGRADKAANIALTRNCLMRLSGVRDVGERTVDPEHAWHIRGG
jgi:hypothetical protein